MKYNIATLYTSTIGEIVDDYRLSAYITFLVEENYDSPSVSVYSEEAFIYWANSEGISVESYDEVKEWLISEYGYYSMGDDRLREILSDLENDMGDYIFCDSRDLEQTLEEVHEIDSKLGVLACYFDTGKLIEDLLNSRVLIEYKGVVFRP